MQFQCDRCGKRYSTAQEMRAGKSYRFQCRACSHEVIVRGPPAVPAIPLPVSAPAAETPPEGGYFDFRLDDDVVTSQSSVLPAVTGPPPAARAVPDEFTPGLGLVLPPEDPPAAAAEAPIPRRRSGVLPVAAAILVPAVLGGIVAAFLLHPSARKNGAQAADSAPGLLKPVVYVGPVAFEQGEPVVRAPSPARPGTREPARRESPKPSPPRRTAAAQPRAAPQPAPAPEAPLPAPVVALPQAPTALPAAAPAPAAPPPAAATPSAAPSADAVEESANADEPTYAREGFRRPAPETPHCVESGIRLPRDLAGRLPPSVTIRFAVGRDGEADLIQVLGEGVEPRLADALRHAVRACRFLPGTDASGKPTRLWVVMPLRFAQ